MSSKPFGTTSGERNRTVETPTGHAPSWLKAMWLASVVVSGWALYWVSLAA